MLDEILLFNKKYESNNYNGEYNSSNVKIINGVNPIIFSAPHAVRQVRNGNVKLADSFTGGITEYLCKRYNSFGIIRTCNLNDDPNYMTDDISMNYKRALEELIERNGILFLIDVHGCSNSHGFDVIVGTNNGLNINFDSIISKIDEISKEGHLNIQIDGIFSASNVNTISSYIHARTGIDCMQFEMSKRVRTSEEDFNSFISFLDKFIQYLMSMSLEESSKDYPLSLKKQVK